MTRHGTDAERVAAAREAAADLIRLAQVSKDRVPQFVPRAEAADLGAGEELFGVNPRAVGVKIDTPEGRTMIRANGLNLFLRKEVAGFTPEQQRIEHQAALDVAAQKGEMLNFYSSLSANPNVAIINLQTAIRGKSPVYTVPDPSGGEIQRRVTNTLAFDVGVTVGYLTRDRGRTRAQVEGVGNLTYDEFKQFYKDNKDGQAQYVLTRVESRVKELYTSQPAHDPEVTQEL